MDWSSVGSILVDDEQIEEILRIMGFIIFGEELSKPDTSVNIFPGSYPVPLVGRDLESLKYVTISLLSTHSFYSD